jgi:hypothetical protein
VKIFGTARRSGSKKSSSLEERREEEMSFVFAMGCSEKIL